MLVMKAMKFAALLLSSMIVTAMTSPLVSAGLVAYWPSEEGSGMVIHDDSPNNNDGTIHAHHGTLGPNYPSDSPAWTADGKVGGALSFDGDNDYVMVENKSSLNPENITVEAWAYVQEDPINEQVLVAKWHADSWNCKGYDLKVEPAAGDNFLITWGVGPGANEWGSWTVYELPFEARWYHIVGIFDGNQLKLYVDNVLRDTATGVPPIVHATEDLYMGRESDAAMRWFKGRLDEVRIYRKALTQAEVSARYAGEEIERENLVAEWRFEGRGRGLSFDGMDDYVEVSNSSSLSPQGGLSELSVEAWVYGEQIGLNEEGSLVSKFQWDGWGMDNGWFVKLENKSDGGNQENALDIVVAIAFGTDDYIGATVWDAIPVGEWAHIAFTYRGSDNTLKIYANGAEETVDSWWHTSTGGNVASSAESLFMGSEHGTQKWFKGKLDEVRIYDTALTANEIREHYLEGDLTPPISSVDPIVPYWRVQAPFTDASFTVTASVSDDYSGVASVELWYRYSPDNSTWENWTLFGTDKNGTNGWSWSFRAREGYGFYEFLTVATDWSGNAEVKEPKKAEVKHIVAAPIETALGRPPNTDFTKGYVNVGTGGFVYQSSDISVPGAISVSFARTYNSRDNYTGPFGRGWTHSYNLRLSFEGSHIVLVNEDGKRDYYLSGSGVMTPLIDTYAKLENNPSPPDPDLKYTLTRPGRMKYYFREDGRLSMIANRDGDNITFGYTNGNLTTISDLSGDLLQLSYSGSMITQISDPKGKRSVYYNYDGNGNLARYTDLLGENHTYSYSDNLLVSIVQPQGNTFLTNTYDENGAVVSQVDGEGYTTTFNYSHGQTVVTDDAGNSSMYYYGPFYQTIKEIDQLGYSTAYSFDNNCNLTRIVDKAGNQTLLVYDENGNLTNVTEKDGGNFTLTYNQAGDLERVTDPLSRTTELAYDESGRLVSLTNPNGNTFHLDYNENGELENIKDALGNVTTITYEDNTRKVTDPEGHVSVYEYDNLGRLVSYTDPRGNTTRFSYNVDDSVASIKNAIGGETKYHYDINGNLENVIDPKNNETHYDYDNMNRLTEVRIGETGPVTNYEYNYLGLLENVNDARGHLIRYEYNARGDMIKVTDQLGRTTSFTYDPNGNVSFQTDAMGRTTTYTHDAAGRGVKVDYPDGSKENFAYNLLGKLTGASRGDNSVQLGYDNLGRIIEFADPYGRTVSYEYNEVGLLKRLSTAEVSYTFTHDRAYNLVSAEDNEGRLAEYSYDNAGNPENATFSKGGDVVYKVDYEWDELNRLTRLTTVNPSGENIASFEYAYDNNGNRVAENRNIGGSWERLNYGYDQLNQLVEVRLENESGQWRRTYTYDNLGNRLQVKEEVWGGQWENAETENYTYDAANQLENIVRFDGSFTIFAHDNNGNLIGENRYDNQGILVENRSYFYDFNDRLVRVEIGRENENTQVVEYEYDPLGNRVSRAEYRLAPGGSKENENIIYYLNDVAGSLTQVLGTHDNQGNPVQNFMYGINRVAAFGQENYYFVCDGLGSVWGLVDEGGNLVENYSYDEWGVPRRWAGGLNTFGFTGEDYDPVTGLVFLRARYYKPDIGRFITQDDTLGSLKDPLTWNFYIYARNNPATLTDPSGRFIPFIIALAAFFASATFLGGTVYYVTTTPLEQRSVSGWLGATVPLAIYVFTTVATAGMGITGKLAGWGSLAIAGRMFAGFGISFGVELGYQVIPPLLRGDPIKLEFESLVLNGAIGALTFGLLPSSRILGLKIKGGTFLPKLWNQTVKVGINTYRLLGQTILDRVFEETAIPMTDLIRVVYGGK